MRNPRCIMPTAIILSKAPQTNIAFNKKDLANSFHHFKKKLSKKSSFIFFAFDLYKFEFVFFLTWFLLPFFFLFGNCGGLKILTRMIVATLIGQSSRQESYFLRRKKSQIWTSDQLIFDFGGPSDSFFWGIFYFNLWKVK